MNIIEAIKMAIHQIWARKMRSILTMLGIIIGVAAVIALVSIGRGSSEQVTNQLKQMGSNLLMVSITGRGTKTSVEYEKIMQMENQSGVQKIAPVLSEQAKATNGGKESSITIMGTNDQYEVVRNTHVQNGRFLLPIDLETRSRVAVIGSNVVKDLFGDVSPIGQMIKLNGKSFTVVGVLEEKGDSFMGSADDSVLIPFSTAERVFQKKGVSMFYAQATSEENLDQAQAFIEQTLAKVFRNDSDSYRVQNQQEMLDTMSSIGSTMANMLGGIAGISLLVGGIGIMNMMLVSVTERTREIGVRKAIGANTTDILLQFLIEAVVLSLIGGGIGLTLGITGSTLLSSLFALPVSISLDIAMIALGFSCLIGVIFGIFPARKAAKLHPVDALRYE